MARGLVRLTQSVDFERVLRTHRKVQSEHFAVHHLAAEPQVPSRRVGPELSTDCAPTLDRPVDKVESSSHLECSPSSIEGRVWLGAVVPKRHARRAVTRSLIKRQIRGAVASRLTVLSNGLWVVRLRASFNRAQFTSAASASLRQAVRTELEMVFARVALIPALG